ncbi:MAG: PAS domain-containing sensor histidine kinase [wastewater metagenome]|nr:PAS domain-containing sensor histidine kinase [Candidatus Loosdrechtia aerotolerans]
MLKANNKTEHELIKEIEELQTRLTDAEETLHAIRNGEVDAIVVDNIKGTQVYSLTGAEHPYRITVERMHEGTVTLIPDGTILYANTCFGRMMGLPLGQIAGTSFYNFVSEKDNRFFSQLIERGLKEGLRAKITLVTSKNNHLPVYLALNPVLIDDKPCLSIIITDLTEIIKAEEALRMSESKYRLLLENLPQRICYKDKNLVYISCNEHLARDLHIKPDEISGKTDYDLYPCEFAERYRADDKKVMESGHTEDTEEIYIRDGQELIIRMVRTPARDEKGNIIGILVTFLDITEKVTLQKEADRSRHLAALGELAAGIGHEINNPITGVINCAQILLNRGQEGSKEKDLAGRILKEGNRIARIVKSLLSFAVTSDKKEIKQFINIQEIMADTLTLTGTQLRKEGIKLQLDISRDLPEIFAHPQLIQLVFLNVISNARYALNQKYTGMHEEKVLRISGETITMDNQPCVKITFYDHGTGIPQHTKDKVMNPFFTTKPTGKGTGLGLSLCHNIVSNHRGKLTIRSIEGEYTEIAILLPVKLNP